MPAPSKLDLVACFEASSCGRGQCIILPLTFIGWFSVPYPQGWEAFQASVVGYVYLKWIVMSLNPRVVHLGYPSNYSDFKENQNTK